ncbi:NAD(P)-binding protein [Paraphaeosphaeria sporulosa]|uniref:NAD(P)-binding protein n=1 Tax=Paraphaeosphaeria sporulosa TaxID=1460663 RepID=A0A177C5K0_9PLEO|nr:NAD(P)-binding protein [Paraphaeosphaeria sporulosa]OAG02706.1 NAD(P)-binding protein [Paraphaeosphaeria sporulosa]
MEYKRTVLITGGTMNMGYHAALTIARQHPEYLVVISSRSDPNNAASTINNTLSQNNVIFLPLDLSSSSNVRTYAKTWASRSFPPIQALLLNAALQFPGDLTLTDEGIEKTFAITHVGHALLFHLLCPFLAPKARVIITASGVHDPALKTGMPKPIYTSAENLAHPPAEIAKGDGRLHYVNAKLSNIMWTYALHRRLEQSGNEKGISVLAMDPGLMPGSGLAREYPPLMRWLWNNLLPRITPVLRVAFRTDNVHTTKESGENLARLGVAKDVEGLSGKYYEGKKQRDSSVESYEVKKQDDLWEWTVKYAAKDPEELARFNKFA